MKTPALFIGMTFNNLNENCYIELYCKDVITKIQVKTT